MRTSSVLSTTTRNLLRRLASLRAAAADTASLMAERLPFLRYSPQADRSPLFQEDIADLADLGAGAQQVEAHAGEMVGEDHRIRLAVIHDQRLEIGRRCERRQQLVPC